MRYYIAAIIVGLIPLAQRMDQTPPCDITINPNGTWQGDSNNCHMPTWATFHPDGTWTD